MEKLISRFLVLGAGQVGTFVARAIADLSFFVIAADKNPAPGYFARFGPRIDTKLLAIDSLDSDSVRAVIKAYSIDSAILAAGLTSETCNREPEKGWAVNYRGAQNVIRAALATHTTRLVFISSFAVYGRPSVNRISEDIPTRPVSDYGRIKAATEELFLSLQGQGIEIRILRPCGTYGPLRFGMGSRSSKLIESLLLAATTGREITVNFSKSSADEYIYVKDLARAVALAAVSDSSLRACIFNVGTGRVTNAINLSEAIQVTIPSGRLSFIQADEGEAQPIYSMAPLDVSRISNDLNFSPSYDLAAGFRDYLDEARLGR